MSEEINDIYVKAFNQAYLLAKYHPTLIQKILESGNKGIYFSGLEDGKATFDKEKTQNRTLELKKLKGDRSLNNDKER